MRLLGTELQKWQLARILGVAGGVPAILYEAGDVVYTLATYTTPEWLTPDSTYSTATYPDAGALFAGKDIAGFSPVSVGYGTNRLNDVSYGDNIFVIASGHGRIATSPDGTTWTDRPTVFGTDAVYKVLYANGLYIAVGIGGKLATSPDAISWTLRTSSFGTSAIRSLAWNGSVYVAVGDGGKIATSPDGVTWTQRTSGLTVSLYDVVYAFGLFIVVGAGGSVITSPDGITWTARTSQFGTSNIAAIATSGTLLVIVGASGKLATSPDGISWTLRPSGVASNIFDVFHTGSAFVFVSFNPYISFDGITWVERDSSLAGAPLLSGVNANGIFIVTTDSGGAARSESVSVANFTVPTYTAPEGYNVYVNSGVTA